MSAKQGVIKSRTTTTQHDPPQKPTRKEWVGEEELNHESHLFPRPVVKVRPSSVLLIDSERRRSDARMEDDEEWNKHERGMTDKSFTG